MGLDIEEEIRKANERLGKSRVKILRRGGTLWLRGTFPPKPHLAKEKPYQQKIPLGLNATMAGLKKAEQEAKIISAQLELGTFAWLDWIDIKQVVTSKSIGYWVTSFKEDYWSKNTENLNTKRSWNCSWELSFNRLSVDDELSLDLLLEAVKRSQPNTKVRQRLCQHYFRLAKFAGINGAEVLLEFKGNYSPASVNPRNLPSDSLIASTIASVKDENWRWWLGVIACYGLRPSEAFFLDLKEFPVIRVLKTKTGKERVVYPLYPEWAEDWGLRDLKLPNTTETERSSYGQRLSIWVGRNDLPFRAYDLRHCYARRCFEFGIPPDRGAKLMGHHLTIHTRIYRAWIDEEYYRRFFDAEVFREDRPKPPQ